MTNKLILSLNISSYWHPGSGRGSGSHLDALVETDASGLPFVSGRMLKGLLRDAVNRLELWQQLDGFVGYSHATWVETLFGSAGFKMDEQKNTVPRNQTSAGSVRVSDAKLPTDLHQWLAHPAQKLQQKQLFNEVYSTAINAQGVAKNKSLRGMQVVIPLTLETQLEWLGENDNTEWQAIIAEALPLIRAVGSQRSRGYGRVQICIQDKENQA